MPAADSVNYFVPAHSICSAVLLFGEAGTHLVCYVESALWRRRCGSHRHFGSDFESIFPFKAQLITGRSVLFECSCATGENAQRMRRFYSPRSSVTGREPHSTSALQHCNLKVCT